MSDDDFDDGRGFEPGSEGMNYRSFFDEDAEQRKAQKAKERKMNRKQAKVDAKQKRIHMHQEWVERNRQRKQQKEQEAFEKRKAAQKAKYDADMAKKRGNVGPDEVSVKKTSTKKRARSDAEDDAPPLPKTAAKQKKAKGNVEVNQPAAEPRSEVAPVQKYVVPAKRTSTHSAGAQNEVRKVLNKLALENIGDIAKAIAEMFSMGHFPRDDVMDSLSAELSKNCFRNTHLTANSALSYAEVIRAIQLEHGNDTIASVISSTCAELDDAIVSEENDGKVASNIGLFVAHLYLSHSCDAGLPLTILQTLLGSGDAEEGGSVLGVEVSLAMLRACGEQMRARVPSALNKVVHQVHSDKTMTRHRVLLDLLKDIAGGKGVKSKGETAASPDVLNSVLNQLGDIVKRSNSTLTAKTVRKALETINVLSVSFQQCIDPSKPPRWHTQKFDFLAAVEGRSHQQEEGNLGDVEGDDEEAEEDAVVAKKAAIEQLRTKEKIASSQRFGSETKRAIFECITAATDEQDCYHMLARRDPTGANTHDTVSVLLQCCLQEELYNPFYAEVVHRILTAQKKQRMTIQFAIWDRFKVIRIQPVDVTSYLNLACFVVYMFEHDLFSLALLRGLDIHVDSKNINLFTRILLLRCLLELKSTRLIAVFFGGDIAKGSVPDMNVSTTTLRKSLKKFFNQYFVAEDEAGLWMPPLFDVVANGLGDSEKLIEALPSRIEAVRKALRDGL